MKLNKNILARLENVAPEKLEKILARIENPKTTRFSKLVYNHYRGEKLSWELDTATKLLSQNKIAMPNFPKTEKDFEENVASRLQKLAENGDQKAIDTLKEANLA